jgi:predicted DNA-binding transcriptional regulator AlpA
LPPSPDPAEQRHDQRLDSWKAIAQYLGRDRSTVIRWERDSGLPVRRIPGGNGRSVFAYVSEIDEWLAASGMPGADATPPAADATAPAAIDAAVPLPLSTPRPGKLRWLVTVAALLVLAIVAGVLTWKAAPVLASVTQSGQALVGIDQSGRELWRYTPTAVDGNVVAPVVRVGDVDGDGRTDVIAALQYLPRNGDGYGEVVRLDDRGRRLWARALDDRYSFGDTTYGPGWFPDEVLTYQAGGELRIAAAFHHHTWWPDVIAAFDGEGRILGRFVHAGWVTGLNVSADGRWLLASGISNAHGGAMLAVLDSANISGAGPMTGGSLPECGNCPAGAPHRYVVVPWSDLARTSNPPRVLVQVGVSGTIELRAVQRPTPNAVSPELIVSFTPEFTVVQRSASDGFAETHAQLERSGELTHAFADCPWKAPALRQWAPAQGWRD